MLFDLFSWVFVVDCCFILGLLAFVYVVCGFCDCFLAVLDFPLVVCLCNLGVVCYGLFVLDLNWTLTFIVCILVIVRFGMLSLGFVCCVTCLGYLAATCLNCV